MIKKTLFLVVLLCLVTVSAGCISSEDSAESMNAGGMLSMFGGGNGGVSGDLMSMALAQGDMSEEDMAMLESLMSGDYANLMQGSDNADPYGMGVDPYSMAYSESGMNADEMNSLMSLLSSGGAGGYSPLEILTAGDEEALEGMTEEEMAMLEQYLSSSGGFL